MKPLTSFYRRAGMMVGALLLAAASTVAMAADNLMSGAVKTTGTPYEAGWRAPGNSSVKWLGANNNWDDDGEYFRHSQALGNENNHAVLYTKQIATAFTYPVAAQPGKLYSLTGTLWKRNGNNPTTYRMQLATDALNPGTAPSVRYTISSNNVKEKYDFTVGVSASAQGQVYFVYEVEQVAGWDRGGLFDDVALVELGDAAEVNFSTGGYGDPIATQFFLAGNEYTATRPADPVRAGYDFVGWYTDEACTQAYDFSTVLTQGITLYAKWQSLVTDGNLLTGAIRSTGTPKDAGWTAPGNSSVIWLSARNAADDNGEYFRTGQNLDGEGGHSIFYIKQTQTVFAYPVEAVPGKMYRLTGQLWKRNGGDGTTTYRFSLAQDAVDPGTAQSAYLPVQGNNKWVNMSIDLGLSASAQGQTYFLFEVSEANNWQRGGLYDNIKLVELGDAAEVAFDAGEGVEKPTTSQFFLAGTSYKVTKPTTPVRAGYQFDGWFTTPDYTTAFNFDNEITEGVKLYGKWTKLGVSTDNLIALWQGTGRGNVEKPSDFGWQSTMEGFEWVNPVNGPDYVNAYRDNISVNGQTVRVLLINNKDGLLSFPFEGMEPGRIYKFSAKASYFNGTVPMTFAVNSQRDGKGKESGAVSFTAPRWDAYTSQSFIFKADAESGYLTWQIGTGSDRAIAWDLDLHFISSAYEARFIGKDGQVLKSVLFEEKTTLEAPKAPEVEGYEFVGWYADAEFKTRFDFSGEISENTDIYARYMDVNENLPLTDLTISETTTVENLVLYNAKVTGDAKLYLTAKNPLVGKSKVDLAGDANWLYVPAIKYSAFTAKYGEDCITVGGRKLDIKSTDRLAIYRNGFVIIPNGLTVAPMEIYNGENLTGDMMECAVDVFYRAEELGEKFDNKIRSFRLRKGWMAVLANNPDGTGFSKCYIADSEDLIVNSLPEGLEFASFVRVSNFNWVGKKGMSGAPGTQSNYAWYYDWNIGGDNHSTDYEYAAIRQNLGWPSWNDIYNKENISHVSGHNEPDHTDQSNATVEQVLEQWHGMFKAGRRIGSPTPDSLNKGWLTKFMDAIDSLNYRVDYVVAHMYWNSQSGSSLKGHIASQYTNGNNRPVWITEWNNGANWTSESWPTASGPQRDAHCNIIYDDLGNTRDVNRPLSPENAAKQLAWMKDVLPAFDESPYLERHAFYNWVQDARAIILGNDLTPAGEFFADYTSAVGYNAAVAYDHKWHIAPPYITGAFSDTFKDAKLKFYDHNGETGKYYVIQRKVDDGTWEEIVKLYPGKDYTYGQEIEWLDPMICASQQQYRIKAMSYKDQESIFSRIITLKRDAVGTPELTANVLSASAVELTWSKVSGARAYRLERAEAEEGPYEVLADNTDVMTYTDEALKPATTYYYRLSAMSSAAVDPSVVVPATTKALVAPETPTGFHAASGSKRVVLTWDFVYDAKWRLYRTVGDAAARAAEQMIAQDITDTRFVDEDVEIGTTYSYTLQAYNAEGSSERTQALTARPEEGQWAYFRFNENDGTKARDEWGGYHATLRDGATWSAAHKDEAFAVKVSRSGNSYVHLGDGITDGLDNFTVFTRVKFDGGYGRVFDFGQGTGTFMIMAASANSLRYKITGPGGANDYTFPVSLPKDQWLTIAMTYDEGLATLYVDGKFVGEKQFDDVVYPSSMGYTRQNYLGKSQWASDAYADHSYENFMLFDTPLDEERVARLNDDQIVTGIDDTMADATSSMSVWADAGVIYIASPEAGTTAVYGVDGMLVRTVSLERGVTAVEGLAPGFYLVGGHKIALR